MGELIRSDFLIIFEDGNKNENTFLDLANRKFPVSSQSCRQSHECLKFF